MKRAIVACLALSVLLLQSGFSAETDAPQGAAAEHLSIGRRIADGLRRFGLPDEAVVLAISTLPIVELRGSIPVGFMMGMNPWLIYGLSVVGNMLPVPFILLLLGPVSNCCMRFKIGKAFFDWLFTRTRRKTAEIEKYETLGLAIFVAIPLPATGAWTGAVAAFLLGMKFNHSLVSILLGVMIAGVIMTVVSFMGWLGGIVAFVVLTAMAVGAMLQMFKREERTQPSAAE